MLERNRRPALLLSALVALAACARSGDPAGAGGGTGPGDGDGGTPSTPPTSPAPTGRLFAPYVDLSLTSSQDLLAIQQASGIRTFSLAFVVDDGRCEASWGGLGQGIANDVLPNGTTIQALVDGVRKAGGDVIVSFGGANGVDVSPACRTVEQVQAMYQSVIDRYGVSMIDLDIEGWSAGQPPAVDLRNEALKRLKAANPGLVVSYTLPVLPTGLVETGLGILRGVKASGLALDVVNIMAMDYGAAIDNQGQMGVSGIQAATATLAQLREVGLDATTLGVTPMIGVNDVSSEIFRLEDAAMLLEFARAHPWVSRLSMWSVSRDRGGCDGQRWASPVCSGLSQDDHAFTRVLNAF
jgi:hypothetical protein